MQAVTFSAMVAPEDQCMREGIELVRIGMGFSQSKVGPVYDISSIPEVLSGLFHLLVKTRDVEQTSMELCPNPPTSPDSGFLKLKCPVP